MYPNSIYLSLNVVSILALYWYFGAKVYTIWVHGSFGFPGRRLGDFFSDPHHGVPDIRLTVLVLPSVHFPRVHSMAEADSTCPTLCALSTRALQKLVFPAIVHQYKVSVCELSNEAVTNRIFCICEPNNIRQADYIMQW